LITAAVLATVMMAANAGDKPKENNGKPREKKETVSVPEPPTIVLLGTGLVVLGLAGLRRRRRA
jgi:hypothetical protein